MIRDIKGDIVRILIVVMFVLLILNAPQQIRRCSTVHWLNVNKYMHGMKYQSTKSGIRKLKEHRSRIESRGPTFFFELIDRCVVKSFFPEAKKVVLYFPKKPNFCARYGFIFQQLHNR